MKGIQTAVLLLLLLLLFTETAEAQGDTNTVLVPVVVVIPFAFLFVYLSLVLTLCIGNVYRWCKARSDEKHLGSAAEPRAGERDIEQSLVLQNPAFQDAPDSTMPYFGTGDTMVHLGEHTSPQKVAT